MRSVRIAAAALAAVAAAVGGAPELRACTPSAEGVMVWDLKKDLVVVGVWPEREEPPPDTRKEPPRAFELRRISTGERIVLRDCENQVPCAYSKLLAKDLPAGANLDWRSGKVFSGSMWVEEMRNGGGHEVALSTRPRGRPTYQRILWVSVMQASEAAQERRRITFAGGLDIRDGEALVSFEVKARGGNCAYTFVRVMRMPEADLVDPRRKGRQAELLKRPARKDDPFEYWRTLADLGPLPPDRLIEAMEAAAHDAQVSFAARWWREATRDLSRARVAQLTEAVKKSPALSPSLGQFGR